MNVLYCIQGLPIILRSIKSTRWFTQLRHRQSKKSILHCKFWCYIPFIPHETCMYVVNYNLILCELFLYIQHVNYSGTTYQTIIYNFYIIKVHDTFHSTVHPMKYLESDVMWYKYVFVHVVCILHFPKSLVLTAVSSL